MNTPITRRHFFTMAAGATVAAAAAMRARAEASPNSRVRVAVMGTNGRGIDHIKGFLSAPNTEIVYICDVDQRALEKGILAAAQKQPAKAKGGGDGRKQLQDFRKDRGHRALRPNFDSVQLGHRRQGKLREISFSACNVSPLPPN